MARDRKKYPRNKGNPKLSQRFVRKRREDEELRIEEGKTYFDHIETDDYWNPFHYTYNKGERIYKQELYNVKEYHSLALELQRRLYAELLLINNSPFKDLKKKVSDFYGEINKAEAQDIGKEILSEDLENSLLNHQRRIEELFLLGANEKYDLNKLISKVKSAMFSLNNQVFTFFKIHEFETVIKNLLLFTPYWVKSPFSWNPKSDVSLPEHVLKVYETPKFLNSIWDKPYDAYSDTNMFFYWFILLSRGRSINKNIKLFDWNIDSEFTKNLFAVPTENSIALSFIHAYAIKSGGSKREYNIVKKSIDLSSVKIHENESSRDALVHFVKSSIRWIIKFKDELSEQECQLILFWANHKRTEANRHNLKAFSWSGRKLQNTLYKAEEYHALIVKNKEINLLWIGNDFDWDFLDGEKNWQFVELKSSEQLNLEGFTLNHCVGSYYNNCHSGDSAIVSLRLNSQPKITIEVNLDFKEIEQIKGKNNREPSDEEMQIIRNWMRIKNVW